MAVYPPAGWGNAGRFTPSRTGERRLQCGGLLPAGRGNAGRFTPCRAGERRYWNVAVHPCRTGNYGRFTPCRIGERRLQCGGLPPCRTGERRAVYRAPLPDGGTADLECGSLPPCRTGARRFGLWRFTPVMVMSQPPLPTSSQNKCDRISWMQCARQGAEWSEVQ